MRLQLENITKYYGKNRALNEFSHVLEPGIYALLGPNGSGKSTLMNIIAGNLGGYSGKILLAKDGEAPRETAKMGAEFRDVLGYMPQYTTLYPTFTVYDFMWYMAALKGIDKRSAAVQIEEILNSVELWDARTKQIRALSGGMRQRLALAQAVLGDPSVLLLDEPTAGLDPIQRVTIKNYIAKIAFNKIVLIATHIVPEVEYIAREAILLKKGDVIAYGAPSELSAEIEGKVWLMETDEGEVAGLYGRLNIVSISKSGDKVELRVISDEKPAENAVPTAPGLEDRYLYTFSR